MAYATLVGGLTCFKKTCKTLGYIQIIVCEIPPGEGKAISISWSTSHTSSYNKHRIDLHVFHIFKWMLVKLSVE